MIPEKMRFVQPPTSYQKMAKEAGEGWQLLDFDISPKGEGSVRD